VSTGPVVEAPPDPGIGAKRSWGVMSLDEDDSVRPGLPAVAAGIGPRLLSPELGLLQEVSRTRRSRPSRSS
jgi:hypothetical protein